MTPRKLKLRITTYPYSGNSTGSSLTWPTAEYLIKLAVHLKTNKELQERLSDTEIAKYCDTPVTAVRNKAVAEAQRDGVDVLMMLDSDMHPDVHFGEHPDAVPFFDTAFNKIYEHYEKGPLVIGAPYGGSPPHENMFVFKWAANGNLGEEGGFELRQYTREEARELGGIHEVDALPTGLILYDVRAFDYIEPPYFRYEWSDETESEKASTEDVQNTRDIAAGVIAQLGYNPLLCTWSSWAGHIKNWTVKKPHKFDAHTVNETLQRAMARSPNNERIVDAAQYISPRFVEECNRRMNAVDKQVETEQEFVL